MINLKDHIIDIPNFPTKGILFKDISPLIKHHFNTTIKQMTQLLSTKEWNNIDYIAGVESRGFIFAAGLASIKNKGLIPIRKKGKLPGKKNQISYDLEYGSNTIEMTPGSGKLLIIDDIIATGGTLTAACTLAEQSNYKVQSVMVLINLSNLNTFQWKNINLKQVITY